MKAPLRTTHTALPSLACIAALALVLLRVKGALPGNTVDDAIEVPVESFAGIAAFLVLFFGFRRLRETWTGSLAVLALAVLALAIGTVSATGEGLL